ncbi:hypothetical protein AtubIFM57258_000045 [Aspergillus tubingensis]|nr:hypothetical protein AtubIFM57258_000045 [Aspergillus tubingensis]
MTSKDRQMRDKSRQLFLETLHYLEQMSIAWGWAKRSVRALGLVSRKWRVHDILKNRDQSPVESSLVYQDERQNHDSEIAGGFDAWLQDPLDLPLAFQAAEDNSSLLGGSLQLDQELFNTHDSLSAGDDAFLSGPFPDTNWEHEFDL